MAWQGIEVVHVVTMDKNNCIGKAMLYRGISQLISNTLKRLPKAVLSDGRKTLESMGRALPNRVNWVITRDVE